MLEYWWVGLIVFVLFIIVAGVWSTPELSEDEKREAAKRQEIREEEKRQKEEKKRRRNSQWKYSWKTEDRRKLIAQLYADSIDLEEIAFILHRAGYVSPTGEEITRQEIMEEYADIQIEKHKKGDED
ncbi:MAG: hypothetical protein OXF50_12775 [Caldilineaceae bacterium]|nr:hypothetical protein [Caldilineaceae bacterium]